MRIALISKMGAGKTELANYLVKMYKYSKFSCAASLKNIAKQIGMVGKDRKLLQNLGFAIRSYDNYFFAKNLINEIGDAENVVVDDVRYIEEYELLKKAGFVFVKKEVAQDIRVKRLASIGMFPTEEQLNHDSEVCLDKLEYDHLIEDNTDKSIPEVINELSLVLLFEKLKGERNDNAK